MKNKIEDLRNHLFAQLERLQDDDLKLEDEIKRAAAMVPIAQTLIDTARVENEFLRILEGQNLPTTGFIPVSSQKQLNGGRETKLDDA